jgi:precorrin-2 dehydrogenase/sirohydrochlorin ferrochelatase
MFSVKGDPVSKIFPLHAHARDCRRTPAALALDLAPTTLQRASEVMIPIVVDPKQSAMALIGRGEVAARRLELLLAGGADQITVFSDAPSPHLAGLAAHRLHRHLPSAAELARFALLWIADLAIAEAAPLARAARAGGCLVNVEDVVAFCDFHNPAQVRRGDLLLTVSTGGKSPGLAARIRAKLARAFGPDWALRLERIGEQRAAWRREERSLDDLARLTNAAIDAQGWLAKDLRA